MWRHWEGLWEVIRIRWGHVSRTLTDGIRVLWEWACFPPSAFCCGRAQWEAAVYTWKRILTRTGPCWHCNLELLAPRIVQNKFLLFKSHPVYGICYSSLRGQLFTMESLLPTLVSHLLSLTNPHPPLFLPSYVLPGIFVHAQHRLHPPSHVYVRVIYIRHTVLHLDLKI